MKENSEGSVDSPLPSKKRKSKVIDEEDYAPEEVVAKKAKTKPSESNLDSFLAKVGQPSRHTNTEKHTVSPNLFSSCRWTRQLD